MSHPGVHDRNGRTGAGPRVGDGIRSRRHPVRRGSEQVLPIDAGELFHPRYSPDGVRIAYIAEKGPQSSKPTSAPRGVQRSLSLRQWQKVQEVLRNREELELSWCKGAGRPAGGVSKVSI